MKPHERSRTDNRSQRTAELLEQAAKASPDERDRLLDEVVRVNVPVAESIARRFARRGESVDDLTQAACVGLVQAVRRFDPTLGHDLLTFAVPTMTGEVKRHFREHAWTVKPPRRIQELQIHISSAAAALAQELGRSPRPSEIADYLDVDVADVEEALSADGCYDAASLEDQGPGGDGYVLADLVEDIEDGYSQVEAVTMLRSVCPHLQPRDKRILYLRFYHGLTQQQIAAEIGVTQMQVSRLLRHILRSLRNSLEKPGVTQSAASPGPCGTSTSEA